MRCPGRDGCAEETGAVVERGGHGRTGQNPGQSTAERVADVLRLRITEGELSPGTRLSEDDLARPLGVSRNTLREAFRLLTHDGLLVHRLHRGVFVSELDAYELWDLYRLRRILECGVVRSLTTVDDEQRRQLSAEVVAAEEAAARGDWSAVGTANMRFHQCLVGLAGSPRIDRVSAQLLAELRLVFHVVADPRRLYEPYVVRNRLLLDLLETGAYAEAADQLDRYLRDSEGQLLAAYRTRTPAAATRGAR